MLGPHQKALADALASGKYRQTYYCLHDKHGYCCLGVACDLARHTIDTDADWHQRPNYYTFCGTRETLPPHIATAYRFHSPTGHIHHEHLPDNHPFRKHTSLAYANDKGVNFDQLAAAMRNHPKAFFSNPA